MTTITREDKLKGKDKRKVRFTIIEGACTFLDRDFYATPPQGGFLGKRKERGHFICACNLYRDCDASIKRVENAPQVSLVV